MKLKFFVVSGSVSVPLNKGLYKKIFFGPFSATFGKIRPLFGHKFFPATLFFPGTF
jgi:hypothetical protein